MHQDNLAPRIKCTIWQTDHKNWKLSQQYWLIRAHGVHSGLLHLGISGLIKSDRRELSNHGSLVYLHFPLRGGSRRWIRQEETSAARRIRQEVRRRKISEKKTDHGVQSLPHCFCCTSADKKKRIKRILHPLLFLVLLAPKVLLEYL